MYFTVAIAVVGKQACLPVLLKAVIINFSQICFVGTRKEFDNFKKSFENTSILLSTHNRWCVRTP